MVWARLLLLSRSALFLYAVDVSALTAHRPHVCGFSSSLDFTIKLFSLFLVFNERALGYVGVTDKRAP